MPKIVKACLLAALCMISLGCDRRPKVTEEAVVRVNGSDITSAQVRDEMLRSTAAAGEENRQGALDALIDRQLLQAEAIRNKLDRDPTVHAAIESAKAQILAQAYLQSRKAYIAKPSVKDVQDYYRQHPEKYSNRKSFDLYEIMIAANDANDEFKLALDQAKTMDDVVAWLDGRRISYTHGRRVRSTDDISATMTAALEKMEKGQRLLLRDGNTASVVQLLGEQSTPLTMNAASAQIERSIMEQRAQDLGQSELSRLRAVAKLEYFSDAGMRNAGLRIDELQASVVSHAKRNK